MKFICDQMCAGLGRWLRAAGYDTTIISNSCDDREILKMALEEKRLLLTCDRHFLQMRAKDKTILFIENSSIVEGVRTLNAQLHLNWLFAPFSRCLSCNTVLEKPSIEEIKAQAPAKVLTDNKDFLFCPYCQKVYWKGTHTERMQNTLQVWQSLNSVAS